MQKTIHALLLAIILTLVGCDKPIPNPESIDPIYQDLVKEAAGYEKGAIEEEKKLKEANAELDKMEARDPAKKQQIRMIFKTEKNINALKEGQMYFEVRAEQRKKFVQSDYLKAFDKHEQWPKPEEYQAYLLRKKLQNASRNWDDRVPKLTRHNKPVNKPVKASGEAKGEGGEGKSSGSHAEGGEKPSGH